MHAGVQLWVVVCIYLAYKGLCWDKAAETTTKGGIKALRESKANRPLDSTLWNLAFWN